jgi:RHS repeat-associated protein
VTTCGEACGRGRAARQGGTPNGSATLGYYVNDMVASETVGSTTQTYALDPALRIRSFTNGTSTTTNHYTTASGDSPARTATGSVWSRNITGIGGELAAIQTNTGTLTLQLVDLRGDVAGTIDDSTGASLASHSDTNEFGNLYTGTTTQPTYGWLGGEQRSHNTASGLILMGVRLYNPHTGRFDQTDPVPGGSANPYDYAG